MHAIRPWLFLGKYRDTLNFPYLKANGIEAMLQFAELVEHPDMEAFHLAVEDGIPLTPGDFQRGIHYILLQYQKEKRLLIACGAGISRSVVFTIAALKETEGADFIAAYEEIVKAHIGALPHPVLWKSFCAYYQEDVPYIEVLRHYNRFRS